MIRLRYTNSGSISLLIFLLLIFNIKLILVEVVIQRCYHLRFNTNNRLAIGQERFFIFLQGFFILWADCEDYWYKLYVDVLFSAHVTHYAIRTRIIYFLLQFWKGCFLSFQFIQFHYQYFFSFVSFVSLFME